MKQTSAPSHALKSVINCLATGFYVGKIKWMPGTFGTLIGIPLVWALAQGGPGFYVLAMVLLIPLSSWIAELHEHYSQRHDPGEIVIDEIVGFVMAMTWLPLTWQALGAAFILFRIFDIIKPFPIGFIDRKVKGGFGTVLDDLTAGLVVNIILQIVFVNSDILDAKTHGAL